MKSKNSDTQNLTNEQVNYVLDFAKGLSGQSGMFLNPYIMNSYLKNTNMNPMSATKDQILEWLKSPQNNEQNLRRISEHFDNVQMPYKKLVKFYSEMLTFDHTFYCVNATEDDMKKDAYKKDEERIFKYLHKLNPKFQLPKINRRVMLEDAHFIYLRENEKYITLQEMPIDYCLIDSKWDLGWLYSFNMMYFIQPGVNIDGFPPEFKKWFDQTMDSKKNNTPYNGLRPELRNGSYAYWRQIPVKDSWIFKFNSEYAGLTPPLASILPDMADINVFKGLQSNKYIMEAYKLLVGTIPLNKDSGRTGNVKDNFAVSADKAGQFINLINQGLPDILKMSAVPFDKVESFDFENKENDKDIMARAMQNLYQYSGEAQFLFSPDRPNASNIEASKKVSSEFVTHLYEQYDAFTTYQVNKDIRKDKPNKFIWKVKYEGTMWDSKERQDKVKVLADMGLVLEQDIGASQGYEPLEFRQKLMATRASKFIEKAKPLQTAFTQSKDKPNGRPTKNVDDLAESSTVTRDQQTNVRT